MQSLRKLAKKILLVRAGGEIGEDFPSGKNYTCMVKGRIMLVFRVAE